MFCVLLLLLQMTGIWLSPKNMVKSLYTRRTPVLIERRLGSGDDEAEAHQAVSDFQRSDD